MSTNPLQTYCSRIEECLANATAFSQSPRGEFGSSSESLGVGTLASVTKRPQPGVGLKPNFCLSRAESRYGLKYGRAVVRNMFDTNWWDEGTAVWCRSLQLKEHNDEDSRNVRRGGHYAQRGRNR
jgi:hypothetical protein